MNLSKLLNWAVNEKIIDTTFDLEALQAIRKARNFFGHATRIMKLKTVEEMEKGEFDKILPTSITLPEWFKEMQKFDMERKGTKIDHKKPVLGWLDRRETAINAYKATIEFIERTSVMLQ